jgi:hypothetical protein
MQLLLLLLLRPALGSPVLLLTGGSSGRADLASVEVVGSGPPCAVPALPAPRAGHATLLAAGGLVLTCGGASHQGTAPALHCLQLNLTGPGGATWAPHSVLPGPRLHPAAVSLPRAVLLLGGWGAARTSSVLLPRCRAGGGGAVQGRDGLGAGPRGARPWCSLLLRRPRPGRRTPARRRPLGADTGRREARYDEVQVAEWRPGGAGWRQLPALAAGRWGHACARLGGGLLVAGGFSAGAYTASALRIDLSTGRHYPAAPMVRARG